MYEYFGFVLFLSCFYFVEQLNNFHGTKFVRWHLTIIFTRERWICFPFVRPLFSFYVYSIIVVWCAFVFFLSMWYDSFVLACLCAPALLNFMWNLIFATHTHSHNTFYSTKFPHSTERSVDTLWQHVEWSSVLKRLKRFARTTLLLYIRAVTSFVGCYDANDTAMRTSGFAFGFDFITLNDARPIMFSRFKTNNFAN